MKKFNLPVLIFTALSLIFLLAPVSAQVETPPGDAPRRNLDQPRRPNLLAELNLSPDQIRQIRLLNREQQPIIRAAKRRVHEAKQSLDEAIYADNADEAGIQTRLKELQTAQAELFKVVATTEYAVRKTLNPDQIVRFREVRRRHQERMNNLPKNPNNRALDAPERKMLNRERRLRRNN